MADITATQKQALSGMNMSDHEERMKELEAELETQLEQVTFGISLSVGVCLKIHV